MIEDDSYRFTVNVGKPKDSEAAIKGTSAGKRAAFRCLMSDTPLTYEYIKAEGGARRMGARLMAIVAAGSRGRVYLAPTSEMESIALTAEPIWKPEVAISGSSQYLGVRPYGMHMFSHLFTSRQLVALTTFSDLVKEARDRARADALAAGRGDEEIPLYAGGFGAAAYSDSIGVYLACGVDKLSDYNSTLVAWSPTRDQAKSTFARQAFPMVWDYAEINQFAGAAGDFGISLEGGIRFLKSSTSEVQGEAAQADASTQNISNRKIISTDPPYYDNIPYADLSDFFYVWLRRSLRLGFPGLFATVAVPKAEELVAFAYRHEGKLGACCA